MQQCLNYGKLSLFQLKCMLRGAGIHKFNRCNFAMVHSDVSHTIILLLFPQKLTLKGCRAWEPEPRVPLRLLYFYSVFLNSLEKIKLKKKIMYLFYHSVSLTLVINL